MTFIMAFALKGKVLEIVNKKVLSSRIDSIVRDWKRVT